MKFFDVKRIWLFVAIAVAFKIFFYFSAVKSTEGHAFYSLKGDAIDYVGYCENLYKTGQHYVTYDGIKVYSARMPGYVFFYLPIRMFLSQHHTLLALIFLQILLSAISTYYLALLAYKLFKDVLIFYLTFILYCLSSFVAAYNGSFYTESFSTSLLIFSSYLLFTARENQSLWRFFVAGLFMSLVIFFRPYMGLVWALICLFLWVRNKNLKLAIVYGSSFLLMDSLWLIRNYVNEKRIIPLQSTVVWYKSEFKSLEGQVDFIHQFGFHFIYWSPTSQHTWFMSDEEAAKLEVKRPGKEAFPARTFNGGLTYDSLLAARANILCAFDSSQTRAARFSCDSEALRILNKFSSNLRSNRPMDYYVLNRARLAVIFLNQPLGVSLKSLKYPLNVLMVFEDSFVNYLVIIGGLIGLLALIMLHFRNYDYMNFAVMIPLYIVALFGFIVPSDEGRYLVLGFPFLAITCSWLIVRFSSKKGALLIVPMIGIVAWLALHSVKTNIHW
ncbi:MAG: hypothetical protein JWO06_2702 [Bacteroidota bacterium]|nr:hypothetical protein [Bacteroidota bacterium]